MLRFVARRLVQTLPVLLLASVVVFSMLYLVPGDPVDTMLGSADQELGSGRQELVDRVRQELGLNDPLPVQYARWLGNAIRGDLGRSYVRGQPVAELILERFPSTLELAAAGMVVSAALGLTLGSLAALKRNSSLDGVVMLVSLGGVSMPSFWFAILLILVFSVFLGWLPATGSGGLDRLLLPALALGYEGAALIARLTRSSLLEVLSRQYITTAAAKGLPQRTIVLRHALRNALIPIVTILGLQVGRLVAGSVIVETVFARQGIGQLAIQAILTKDFPLVQGTILFAASIYVVTNLLVDLSYGYLDPQLRATS